MLPSIGGIIQLTYYIFYSLNFLYNKYVVIKDCNNSFFRLYNNLNSKDAINKSNFSQCINSLRKEAQFSFGETNRIISALKEKRRDSIYIAKFNRKENSLRSLADSNYPKACEDSKQNNNLTNSNDLIIHTHNNTIINNSQNKGKKSFLNRNEELIDNSNFSKELNEYVDRKNKSFRIEPLNFKFTYHFINIFSFILFLFKIKRKSEIFFVLNSFRQKLLGEEHIFRTNIILYHLAKYLNVKEIQKIDIMELYNNL